MKKTIIISIILTIFLVGCTNQTKPEIAQPVQINTCGNGVCELSEGCGTCQQDCGCKAKEYCEAKSEICKPIICGNRILEPGETSENCCSDAGCSAGLICNENLQKCIEKVSLDENAIKKIVQDYLIEKNFDGTLTSINDVYYENQQAKKITLSCQFDSDYPCSIIIYIDQQGKIIQTINTT